MHDVGTVPQSANSCQRSALQVVPLPLGPEPAPPLPLRSVLDQALQAASAQPGVAVPVRQLPCVSFCTRLPPGCVCRMQHCCCK